MKTKLIAVSLAALLGFTALSCKNDNKERFESTEDDRRVVMTVGGREVQYQEYKYYFLNNKRDSYGADTVITDEIARDIKTLTENNAKQRHGYLIMAEKYDALITKEQQSNADKMVEEYRKNFSDDEAYILYLSEQYITDELYRTLLAEADLPYNILESMKSKGIIKTDDADVDSVLAGDEVICIKEIFVSYNGDETKPIAERRAEEALAKLMDGESFEDIMSEYSSYNSAAMPKDHGVYISRYTMSDEIWNAAADLAEGEHSCVIESVFGYHIVMRCPKDAGYMKEHRDEIYETYSLSKLSEEYYAIIDTLEVSYTEYGSSLDLKAIS